MACGSGRDELNKRLAALQDKLTDLQSHGDRLEQRLQVLEVRNNAAVALAAAADAPKALLVERAPLKVVRLEPGESTEAPAAAPESTTADDGSAADKTPRPVIRVYGNRVDARGDLSDVKVASDTDRAADAARRKRRAE